MKKSAMFISISILLLLATATTGLAEERMGGFSITPFVGGYTFEGNQAIKNAPVYGLRGGYNVTKHFGVEGIFSYVSTEYNALAGNPDVDVYGFWIEGLYHFMPDSRFVPFLAVGTGGMLFEAPDGLKDRERFMVDYGVGFKYSLTNNLALRADVRHVILPLHDDYSNLFYAVGLTYSFGGK